MWLHYSLRTSLVSQGGAGTGAGKAKPIPGVQPGTVPNGEGFVLTHVLHFGF